MKKIVFSSVLVFSILNARTLTTKDDFLNWSPIPSNINPKLAETVNLNYWRDKITDNQIITSFETAVAEAQTAKANLQEKYNHLDGLLKSRFIYDNVINILVKNGLDDGLDDALLGRDIADPNNYDNTGGFLFFLNAETQKEKTTKKITEKEGEYQAKLEKLGIDDSNKEQVYKLIRLKLLNDELAKVALNFDPKTIDIINNNTDILKQDSVDYKILSLYSRIDDFQYLIDNYKEDKSILLILIEPDGVDKLIREVEKKTIAIYKKYLILKS